MIIDSRPRRLRQLVCVSQHREDWRYGRRQVVSSGTAEFSLTTGNWIFSEKPPAITKDNPMGDALPADRTEHRQADARRQMRAGPDRQCVSAGHHSLPLEPDQGRLHRCLQVLIASWRFVTESRSRRPPCPTGRSLIKRIDGSCC